MVLEQLGRSCEDVCCWHAHLAIASQLLLLRCTQGHMGTVYLIGDREAVQRAVHILVQRWSTGTGSTQSLHGRCIITSERMSMHRLRGLRESAGAAAERNV